ncbi:MAG: iron-sulfur cluster carrier protein ApbC [Burkholderiaceae bacterium]|nr:iron-sulfur cluster carrier protein ApbC [Pseudomonadota bacterium]MDP4740393.1 iron-sulfur cluster carrier protein ApbC [Burkholderiaceae bacterium]
MICPTGCYSNEECFVSLSVESVRASLSKVQVADLQMSLMDAGMLKDIQVQGTDVALEIEFSYPSKSQWAELRSGVLDAVKGLAGVGNVSVSLGQKITAHAVKPGLKPLASVRNMIAVASGKGGVGKSTTTVNLALALAAEGAKVGVLDADIYGPSIPTMMGASGRPESSDGKTMEPLMAHGLQVNSLGFLIDKSQAMIWRGPMATQALEQLLRQTRWNDLDYLFVDMPPGTGDIHLTLSQNVPITGAVIVTTPQEIALMDARKGLTMFEKVSVPVLGIIENMAMHICSQCGHADDVFGQGGGALMSAEHKVPLLGSLPLNRSIRENADAGRPTLVAEPDGEVSKIYKSVARQIAIAVSRIAKDHTSKFPKIVVEKL